MNSFTDKLDNYLVVKGPKETLPKLCEDCLFIIKAYTQALKTKTRPTVPPGVCEPCTTRLLRQKRRKLRRVAGQ